MLQATVTSNDLRILMTGLVFGESPRWHDGRLWFVDFGAQEVGAVDMQGNQELIARTPGMPMGIGFLPDGHLLIVSVRDGKLLTNGDSDSILLGITRDCVIRIAADLGWSVEIKSLSVEDLLNSDEAFFTGTAAEIVPITQVDSFPIGNGRPGPHTYRIQKAFAEAASGRDSRYRDWLHPVAAATACA